MEQLKMNDKSDKRITLHRRDMTSEKKNKEKKRRFENTDIVSAQTGMLAWTCSAEQMQ